MTTGKTNKIKQAALDLKKFLAKHRPATLATAGAVLIAAAGGTTAYLLTRPLPAVEAPAIVVQPRPEPEYYSPLSGVKVATEKDTTRPVLAVMIENSPDARPQSGLKQSEVVFEAIAEGGITRFLALYQNQDPKLIGPVRSLRPYFVDWLTPFDAGVVHVGGSAKALKQVRNGNYRDVDQFFNANSYWRASDRYAPHNVYTSSQNLRKLMKNKGYKTSSFTGFVRQDEKPADEPTTKSFKINVSSALYNTSYSYDAKNNRYQRSMAGEQHRDREKGLITPKVVIAMMVNEQSVNEDGWRESIKTTGSGTAYIFQNGKRQKAKWHKKNPKDQLSFTNSDNKPVKLVRGQTWITAVPNGQGSVSW